MTTRVVLADDQALIRAGFKALIDATDDLRVVGEAADGAGAVRLAAEARADVVVMDVRMPGIGGIEATRQITSDDDLAGVKVIVLTTFELDELVLDAIHAGASGFVGKGIEPADLLDAIRVVASGEALLSPRATKAMLAALTSGSRSVPAPTASSTVIDVLTAREREVMAHAARGLSNLEIASLLHLAPLTVKTHVNRAMVKLQVRDRAQLVVLAYETGLVGTTPVQGQRLER